jgi:putative N6-adenine-specific DNA methylase
LNLRCASQVLFSIKSFRPTNADDVYQAILGIAWEDFIDSNGYLSVTSTVDHFTINNNLFVNVKVKDAIVDRLRKATGSRPDSGPQLDRTVVHLFWKDDYAEIFADTSGETLAKHGYRKIPGKAPMLEALAAATVLATKWDRRSPFINPMCGSGTVAVEAALIATNRRPGLFRNQYAFMHLKGYQGEMYTLERANLDRQIQNVTLQIVGGDISDDAVNISRINAAAAGVDGFITFEQKAFEQSEIPPAPGVIYFNPEYGERMGDIETLEKTYSEIGDFLKQKCQGYTGYIFTGNLELAKKIGLKASRRIEFYNSKLDCRLLEYELYSGTKRKDKVDAT